MRVSILSAALYLPLFLVASTSMRKTLALTISFILSAQVVFSQEWQGGPGPMSVDQQAQAVQSYNQYPTTPSSAPPSFPYPGQFSPPQESQFQSLPVGGQYQPMPVEQSQLPPQANGGPISNLSGVMPITQPSLDAKPAAATPVKIWEGSFELGLDGSEGNSQTFNLHTGAKLKRKTEFNILTSEIDYKKNNSNSIETTNKAFLDSRFEHLFQESRWTWFVHNIEDYDEFKAYDLRVSIDTGLGYQFVKNDSASLIGRVGGGTTREIGGPDDRFIPEAVFGLEGEYKISKRQKLCASVEYRPDVTDFEDYRLNSKAAWEVLLDEEKHLSMKVGVLDRYDSNIDGHKPNDLDYSMTLLWSF
jgi:putative salt-induced outer membrane protein YdiY